MDGDVRSRGPWFVTVLCLLGIGVVGAGLAYSIHISSELGDSRRTQTVGSAAGVPVNDQRTGVPITPGREVIGAITGLEKASITVRSAPEGGTVVLSTGPDTQVTTTHGSTLADLEVGDVVIIQVSADGASAQAIYAGQISIAGTPSGG